MHQNSFSFLQHPLGPPYFGLKSWFYGPTCYMGLRSRCLVCNSENTLFQHFCDSNSLKYFEITNVVAETCVVQFREYLHIPTHSCSPPPPSHTPPHTLTQPHTHKHTHRSPPMYTLNYGSFVHNPQAYIKQSSVYCSCLLSVGSKLWLSGPPCYMRLYGNCIRIFLALHADFDTTTYCYAFGRHHTTIIHTTVAPHLPTIHSFTQFQHQRTHDFGQNMACFLNFHTHF